MVFLQEYYDDILQTLRIDKGNPTRTTGSADVKLPADGVSLLSKEDHAIYRSCVGKILWLAPIRPDISYAVKELSRSLQEYRRRQSKAETSSSVSTRII